MIWRYVWILSSWGLVVEGVVALKEGMRVQVMKADVPAEQSEEPAP